MARWVAAQRGKRVWVLTHEAPDGDAIGSLLAAGVLLRHVGGCPVLLCPDPVPAVYSFLPDAGAIRPVPESGRGAEAHLFLDCATAERVGALARFLEPALPSANLDHHESNTRYAGLNWVDPGASSTGEMLARVFRALGAPLGPAAGAIYTAIVTDTGSFAFDSTTPETHRWAAAALRAGVSPADYHSRIYESREPAAVLLLGRALSSIRFAAGGKVAYMRLDSQDFTDVGALREHTNGIVNHARAMHGVVLGLLFSSVDGSSVRVAIRSGQGYSSSVLAARFGGGGHARAAACTLPGPLAEAIAAVLAAAEEGLAE